MSIINKFFVLIVLTALAGKAHAQKDTVVTVNPNDTVRIGNVVILNGEDSARSNRLIIKVNKEEPRKKSRIATSAFIIDLGYSNWSDHTNYADATANESLINRPGTTSLSSKDFKLQSGKSFNVNIWIAAQKLSLINHYLNLKYAAGLQFYNYRLKSNISFSEGGWNPYDHTQDIAHSFVFRDSINFSKNKLAADYATIPLMLNFNSNPNSKGLAINVSAGVSIGYLFNLRNKQVSTERGKKKDHGDYDIRKWKFSYEADLGIGDYISLYGSYTPKSIFKNELGFQPYTIGVRLLKNNW